MSSFCQCTELLHYLLLYLVLMRKVTVLLTMISVYCTMRMLRAGWYWPRLCHHAVILWEITYIIVQDVCAMKTFR